MTLFVLAAAGGALVWVPVSPPPPFFFIILFFYSCMDAMKQLLAILEAMKENFLLSKEKNVQSIL
jgi:hypothetical protein